MQSAASQDAVPLHWTPVAGRHDTLVHSVSVLAFGACGKSLLKWQLTYEAKNCSIIGRSFPAKKTIIFVNGGFMGYDFIRICLFSRNIFSKFLFFLMTSRVKSTPTLRSSFFINPPLVTKTKIAFSISNVLLCTHLQKWDLNLPSLAIFCWNWLTRNQKIHSNLAINV